MKSRKKQEEILSKKKLNQFITQPISQPDGRQEKTGVAMPDDANVDRNKGWVDENGKS